MQALAGRVAGGPDPDAPRRRAPARPRHVRAARAGPRRAPPTPRCRPRCGPARSPASTSRWSRAARPRGAARSTPPLGRDRRSRTKISTDTDDPHHAVTHFETEQTLPEDTLLRVTLETGRTHQIRAHLLAIGHPVAGDPDYGHARRHGLSRQFLHARRLAFEHPANRGTRGPAGATAGGPGQGPPAGVRGTDGPCGVGEPGPTVTAHNAGVRKNFPKLSPDKFPTPGASFLKLTPEARGSCPAYRRAGSAPALDARDCTSHSQGDLHHGRDRPQGAAGSRSPLRPSDAPLEPEDAPLHPRRERRHLPDRPAQDAGAAQRRRSSSRPRSPIAAARSCSSAPRSRRATASRRSPPRRTCRTSTTAGSAAC